MRYAGEVPHFISHMVQMKEYKRDSFLGSDTSFISHMVQMKDASSFAIIILTKELYIPHGSDESASSSSFSPQSSCFISHMVQMKEMSLVHKKKTKKEALYPTWFR